MNEPAAVGKLENALAQSVSGLDISILANNVGVAWGGVYHTIPNEKLFSQVIVNCLSQPVMTKWFLARCAASRKDKKCAIIDFSSAAALGKANPSSVITYGATKSFNRWFSNGVYHEYKKHLADKKDEAVDLDVLTVTPSHVKSSMNSGIYLGTIETS